LQNINAGTIDYAPPEQLNGYKTGTYSDVFSIGATLYKVLTNKRLYEFLDGNPEKISRILSQTSHPSFNDITFKGLTRKHSYFSNDIICIIKRCLSFDPEDRYKSVFEISTDIKKFLDLAPLAEVKISKTDYILKFILRNFRTVVPFSLLTSALFIISFFMFIQNKQLYIQKEKLLSQKNILVIEKKNTDSLLVQTQDILNYSDLRNRIGDIINVKKLLMKGRVNILKNQNTGDNIKAKMLTVLGDSYFGLGEYVEAEELYKEAFDIHYKSYNETTEGYIVAKTKILSTQAKRNSNGDSYIMKEAFKLLSTVSESGITQPYELDVLYLFSNPIRSLSFNIAKKINGFDFRNYVKKTKERLWDEISPTQKVKLLNFQIIEIYYSFSMDYTSATRTLNEEDYAKAIPLLLVIEGYAKEGLRIIRENDLQDVLEIDMLTWIFRINYELKNYTKGDFYSNLALKKAIHVYGENHNEIARLYQIMYAMHSSVDLNLSVNDIISAKNIITKLNPNAVWSKIYYLDFLAEAYLNAGDWKKSKAISYEVLRLSFINDLNLATKTGIDALSNTIKRIFNFFDRDELRDFTLEKINKALTLVDKLWPGWINEIDDQTIEVLTSSLDKSKYKSTLILADKLLSKISIQKVNSTQFDYFYKTNVCLDLMRIYHELGAIDKIKETYELYKKLPKENINYLPNAAMVLQIESVMFGILKDRSLYMEDINTFKIETETFLLKHNMEDSYYYFYIKNII
jgi:serine/threonine protein kinase